MIPQKADRSKTLKLRNRRRIATEELVAKLPSCLHPQPLEDAFAESILAQVRATVRLDDLLRTMDWRADCVRFFSGRDEFLLASLWDWDGEKGMVSIRSAASVDCLDEIHEVFHGCIIAIDNMAKQLFVLDFETASQTADGVPTHFSKTFEFAHD